MTRSAKRSPRRDGLDPTLSTQAHTSPWATSRAPATSLPAVASAEVLTQG